jgi:site-specific DNA-methyltransferase (adenine-specific)
MIIEFINQIIQGDCIEVLAKIDDNSVDVCFADPPFNLEKKYNSYKDQKSDVEYLKWCELWLKELVRITKPSGSIFIHNIPKWLTHFSNILNDIAYFRHWIAWDAMSNPIGKTLLPAHYGILFYSKATNGFKFYEIRSPHKRCRVCNSFIKDYGGKSDQRHPFGSLVSDVWTDLHRIRHSNRRDSHPCQLPIPLLERIILMSSDEGDIILDPFIGTGTTAIAAKALRRNYIGIDLDRHYVDLTKKKLANVSVSEFQGVYVSKYLGKIVSIRDIDTKLLFPPQLTSVQKRKIKSLNKSENDTDSILHY